MAPSPLFDLSGRRALVTGASRGIGLALARALAEAGATLVLNARDATALDRAASDLGAAAAAFDVTDPDAVAAGVAAIERDHGPVDILVNNAGLQRRAPLDAFSHEDWRLLMRTNLDGPFLVAQAVARGMIARGSGKIVNICSVQSQLARPGIAPYAASKGALAMLTRGMCADWARHGLQINGLAPGYIETEMTRPLVEDPAFSGWIRGRTPAGRWGRVEDLAGAVVFLAAPASDFVNGQVLTIDGGLTSVV
ncbi:MAG: SDR family oxidoreductase [Methylobacterium frigidaeris]